MDDEAAFRFSDRENRARTDISDLERGRGYLEALSQFYDNDRNRMAERIGISLSQLNRYILLAKRDEKFVDAIGGIAPRRSCMPEISTLPSNVRITLDRKCNSRTHVNKAPHGLRLLL